MERVSPEQTSDSRESRPSTAFSNFEITALESEAANLVALRRNAETRARVTTLLSVPASRRRGLRPVARSRGEATRRESFGRLLLVPRLGGVRGVRDGVVAGGFRRFGGSRGGGGGFLLLRFELFRIAVEEQIDHDVPRVRRGHGATHLQHHAREKVVQATNG